MLDPVKSLDIKCHRVALDLLKAIAILSDTTVRGFAIDREDLKQYWKSKKGHISLCNQQSYYL